MTLEQNTAILVFAGLLGGWAVYNLQPGPGPQSPEELRASWVALINDCKVTVATPNAPAEEVRKCKWYIAQDHASAPSR